MEVIIMLIDRKKFTRLKPRFNTYEIIGFDIETYGNDNKFLMGSIYGDNKEKVFYSQKEMHDYILNNCIGKILIAHNLDFDFNIFLDILPYSRLIYKNGRVISIKYPEKEQRKNSIYFYDSMNFIPASLNVLAKSIGMEKMEKPYNLGEYPKDINEWNYLKDYNINDSKIAYQFGIETQEFLNQYKTNFNATISSCAMELFRKNFINKDYLRLKFNVIDFPFSSYYGGRTEIFNRGEFDEPLNYYDINSMYPFAMENFEYPIVKNVYYDYYTDWKKLQGFTEAIIISKNKLPLLPLKIDNKLKFPNGKFKGVYTNIELQRAKELNYEIKPIKSLIFPNTEFIFKDFVKDFYGKRMELKKQNNPKEIFFKLCLNSTYGKFAQKLNPIKIISKEQLTDKHYDDYIIKSNKDRSVFYLEAKNKELKHYKNFIMPFWSSYVTAYSRLHLYNYLEKLDKNELIYCDTDSIITNKHFPVSDKLGDLKLETKMKLSTFVKPKFYCYITDKNKPIIKLKGGRIVDKEKDINELDFSLKDYNDFKRILIDKKIKYISFIKLGTSLRFGKPHLRKNIIEKDITINDDKRYWFNKNFNIKEIQNSIPITIK
jgi:hypothetical protein